jgi:hypothetical protein
VSLLAHAAAHDRARARALRAWPDKAEGGRARGSRAGVTLGGLVAQLGELARRGLVVDERRARERRLERAAQAGRVVPGPARERLVQRGAQQVDVGVGAERRHAPLDHLGREVARRAHQLDALARARGLDGDPPVEQVDLAVGAEHHVVGLEIAVHHAALVGELERVAHPLERRDYDGEAIAVPLEQGRPRRVLGVAQEGRERGALDSLHEHEGRVVAADAERVHGHDVGVLEPAHRAGLVHERRLQCGAAFGARALDGDVAA